MIVDVGVAVLFWPSYLYVGFHRRIVSGLVPKHHQLPANLANPGNDRESVNVGKSPTAAAEIDVPSPLRIPLMDVVKVIAGVVVALATVPAKPFALATDTVVTVPPVLVEFSVVPEKDKLLPSFADCRNNFSF